MSRHIFHLIEILILLASWVGYGGKRLQAWQFAQRAYGSREMPPLRRRAILLAYLFAAAIVLPSYICGESQVGAKLFPLRQLS